MIKRKVAAFTMSLVMASSLSGSLSVQAAEKTEYPMCYGKFTTNYGETEFQPVIVYKNTVYVNMWEFASLLNYSPDSYQSILDSIRENALTSLKNKEITPSFYSRAITSLANEAKSNIDSVSNEWNFLSNALDFINTSSEKLIDNAIDEAKDTYVLERRDSEYYGGVSWYIDVGSKIVSAMAGNKSIVTYTLDSKILSTSPENPDNKDDIWIPFDALCQMFGCSWYINKGTIQLGTSMPYTENFVFNDYSGYACNPKDFINCYGAMSNMSNLLDSIGDGLDSVSSFNFKALDKLCEGVTTDEYDYLANAILYLDFQETKQLRQMSETLINEQLPVLDSLLGDDNVQNLLSQTTEVDLEKLKVALKVSDETLNAIKTSSELLSIASQSSRLLLDCAMTYDHMAHVNEDGLEALKDFFEVYSKEYCTDCKYCDNIELIPASEIQLYELEKLEDTYGKREAWFYNQNTQKFISEIDCKNNCGNIPCNFMRNMQEMTELYDSTGWEEDYKDYVSTSLLNEVVSFTLSNILEELPPVAVVSILNVGWQAITELVNSGTGVMDYYEAVGYMGPAYKLEADSAYLLDTYRKSYKEGGKLDTLKSLTYINLKSYYVANTELDVIFDNSLNDAMRTSNLASNRAEHLSYILSAFLLADQIPVEYEKRSKTIIDSDVLYQKVVGTILSEDEDGNKKAVKKANIVFTKGENEYILTTDSKGMIIDKKTSEAAYVPDGKFSLLISANGYKNYEDEVKISLKKECDLKEIILEKGNRMPMAANFYIGADFNNLMNDGLITESAEYVYYNSSKSGYIYRYTKADGTVIKLSNHGGSSLNVSEDDYLYVVDDDKEIWEINGLTGETRRVLEASDWGNRCLSSWGINEIQSMLLINDDLYVLFTGYRPYNNTYEETAVLATLNRESAEIISTIQIWSGGTDYQDYMNLEFAFVAAEDDVVYFSWRQNDGQLKLYSCNVTDYIIYERPVCSENGSEINEARNYNSTGLGNGYSYDVPCYDVEFWDAVSDEALYSFNRTWKYGKYTVFDFFTDSYYEPEDPLRPIRENVESWSVHKTAFYDGSFYILSSENIIYRLSEDLMEGTEFYSMRGSVDSYGDKIIWSDWGYGFADNAVWLLYPGNTYKISLDGSESFIDTSDVADVENPYDINIYGTVKSNVIGKSGLYETPDAAANLRIRNVNSGTKVKVIAKIITTADVIYYQVQLEDGTEGYMLGSALSISVEPETVLNTDRYGNIT